MIYWHWRRLYELVLVGTPDPRTAAWMTARLLRAKLRTDLRHRATFDSSRGN